MSLTSKHWQVDGTGEKSSGSEQGIDNLTEQEEFVGASEPGAIAADEPNVEQMSFEAALAQLEAIVQKLERGQLDLDQSIEAYELGTRLRKHCDGKLRDARLRLEKLTLDEQGHASLESMDAGSAQSE